MEQTERMKMTERTGRMRRRVLGIVMAAVMALGVGIPATAAEFDWLRAAVAGYQAYQAYTLSDEEVIEYVKQSVAYMDRNNKVLPSSNPYSQRLQKLTAGMKQVDGVPLNFKVYEVSYDVNAFACADGSVRVYTSLMDLMTDEELLGVIGHEIGHVGKHHSRKALKNQLLTDAFREALASSSNTLGALADSQLGDLGLLMATAKYSRKQEQEADDYGYEFLKKAGKNPRNMVKALEKLKSLEKKSGKMSKMISNMFSSHPDTDDRIARLKKRCEKEGY